MASGSIGIEPIWRAIGAERAKALSAFHAFTGADNTRRFSRTGKATWLQVYMKTVRDVISSLLMLSIETEVTETMLATLASFVGSTYSPRGIYITTISEL
jgi:hypothetical protein